MKILEYEKDTFPEVVKLGRKRLGLTQRQFAKLAHIEQDSLSTIERGCNIPSVNHLIKICLTLGFDEVRIDLWRDDTDD